MMRIDELRSRHPVLHYHSFSIELDKEHVSLRFHLELEPGISFFPTLVFESPSSLSEEELAPFAFHVGLAELASYWKCACPKEIRIAAGALSEQQCAWWYDLLLHGMGEFYYRNQIDFTRPDFLTIHSTSDAPQLGGIHGDSLYNGVTSGGFILAAGGKDSSLTLELLREERPKLTPFMLNPTRAALESANIAGFRHPAIARRRIDPTLLSLNAQGYLNGHTPFSSYLAFASLFCAAASGTKEILVSNEQSANQENVVYLDLPINHQYSKTLRFESKFREYVATHLSASHQYFSFLRPLYEIQVAGLFARHCKKHFRSFRSCNVGSKQDHWCGRCPKCVFTYLMLAAFIPPEEVESIFGEDISKLPEFETEIRGLLGLDPVKPFECVGTIEESRQALSMIVNAASNRATPPVLSKMASLLGAELPAPEPERLDELSDQHEVPEQYITVLEDAVFMAFSDES